MDNLELMRRRLEWQGGIHQEDRMIKDKWRTLQRTLKYSYQAATVSLVQKSAECLRPSEKPDEPIGAAVRALINPDRVKQDYDDKILSIDYECGFEPGDVFKWHGTDTYWLIYLEELTEDAYFRGAIRRCRYQIKFKDEEGNWCATWAAIRGPVETQIDSIQKNQVRIDNPNLSLNILIPRNEKTLRAFDRYDEFLFAGRCWQVKAPDSISMRNVIEVAAGEHYIDRDTDDIEAEMKNGLVIEPIDPTPESGIRGETWIKPLLEEVYEAPEEGGTWDIDKGFPVTYVSLDDKSIKVKWQKTTHGQFDLRWISKDGKVSTKTIVVESLF